MSIFINLAIIISSPHFVTFHYCYLPFPYFHCRLPCLFVNLLKLMILHIWFIEGGYVTLFTAPLALIQRFWLERLLYGREFRHSFVIRESLLILYVSR